MSEKISTPKYIKINRYIEGILAIFNVLVAIMLLTAPWYIVENGTVLKIGNIDCNIPEGTVLVPFLSKPCGKGFTEIPNDGPEWKQMQTYVWIYLTLSVFCCIPILYDVTMYGIREWENANTFGFIVQLILIIIQTIIISKNSKLNKPMNVDASTANILINIAISISVIRLFMLTFYMYVTKKYNPRGWVGTGSNIY